MGKLTCGCLNVRLHAKKADFVPLDVAKLELNPSDARDPFFNLEISEAILDLEGINVEHSCLVKNHRCGDWVIHECVNCEMLTYALHSSPGSNRILLNLSLKRDPTIIERLETSPDFSPLYKIVLRSKNDNHPVRQLGLQSGKYESLQQTLTSIQEQLNKFLISEEAAVEDRIRLYEEQQRAYFAELQSKARRDKNAMISLVLSSEDPVLSDSTSKGSSPFSPTNKHQDFFMVGSDDIEEQIAPQQHNDLRQAPKPTYNMTSPVKRVAPIFSETKKHDPLESDAMFDLDGIHDDLDGGFHDDNQPFYISDDENDDTDDSSTTDEPMMRRYQAAPKRSIYSSSVPISVPCGNWQLPTQRSIQLEEEDEEDRREGLDPVRMAASIQALARSVHGDGTEMFGDLPRPRLNTLDMGKL